MTQEKNQVEVLDLNTINYLKMLNDESNPDFFDELIELYLNQTLSLIGQLKETVTAGNVQNLEKVAHRLKGSSLNLGALVLAEICGKLECKGKNNDSENIMCLMKQLETQYQGVSNELLKLKTESIG